MPISPVRSASSPAGLNVDSGWASAALTLNGVSTGNALIAVVAAFRSATTIGNNLINGVESRIGGTLDRSFTLARRQQIQGAGGQLTEVTIWFALNVSAGNTNVILDFNYEDDSTTCRWGVDEWPSILTTGALDVTSSGTAASNTASLTTTTTATLAQAVELAIGVIGNRENFSWNGSGADPGAAPAGGWTVLRGQVQDNANDIPWQAVYRETAATSGFSITWNKAQQLDSGTVAAVATFRIGTTNRRARFVLDPSVNGATGITAYIWRGLPETVGNNARRYNGITAEASGGIVLVPLGTDSATYVTGESVNALLMQPAGTRGTTLLTGTIETY